MPCHQGIRSVLRLAASKRSDRTDEAMIPTEKASGERLQDRGTRNSFSDDLCPQREQKSSNSLNA